MSGYKQILTDLYSRYNPEKIGDVDVLLAKYAGREREMVLKIYMKYGGPTARKDAMRKLMELELENSSTQTPAGETAVVPVPEHTAPARRKNRWPWKRKGLLILALGLISGLTYAGWYVATTWPGANAAGTAATDPPLTTPIYVLANAVIARSTCVEKPVEGESSMVSYGERLERYWRIDDCIQLRTDTVDGQAVRARYYPDKYFCSETTFREIDAIFGNEEARQQVEHSYEKRALRQYFRTQGITGKLDADWIEKVAGPGKNPAVYQIFADQSPAQLNNWLRGYFFQRSEPIAEDQRNDLACIIAPEDRARSKNLVVFSFGEDGGVLHSHRLDLQHYPRHKIRLFPETGEDYSRFFANDEELYAGSQKIILEDPEGEKQDYLLLINENGIRLQNEVPRDTIRLPGMPPFIL